MTSQTAGGLSALLCAATYLIGFALLVSHLAPLGYGTAHVDPHAVVTFIHANPVVLIVWNTTIYILNGLSLVVLVMALAQSLKTATPSWASVTGGLGLIWAALVISAGMIANIAAEQALHLYPTSPDTAASVWAMLHAVELGLGGGNEIVGGCWILGVSVLSRLGRVLHGLVVALGLATGCAGVLTLVPAVGDAAGACFGLGAIVWFVAVGVQLLCRDLHGTGLTAARTA